MMQAINCLFRKRSVSYNGAGHSVSGEMERDARLVLSLISQRASESQKTAASNDLLPSLVLSVCSHTDNMKNS